MLMTGSIAVFVVFVVCALAVALVGVRLSALADRLADRTGIGEAMLGAVLLGGVTSLSGIAASITAAADGRAALALSNAIGGIAVQTAFLVIGDIVYRKANLEHAAASAENMMQAALLVVLLALILSAMLGPRLVIGGLHVLTPVLVATYLLAQRMIYRSRHEPMWRPRMTTLTRVDRPPAQDRQRGSLAGLAVRFTLAAGAVVVAGAGLARAAGDIAVRTGLSESLVGALLLATATSLPELVTCVAAVRRGALTLAVGGILGGNTFDTLFAAAADLAYRPGSIYHAGSRQETWLVCLSILMTSVLLLGLLRREKSGIGNIGFESAAVLLIYLVGMSALLL